MKIYERPGLVACSLLTGERLVASTYGGQVLSWTDRTGRELLYTSELSTGEGGEAVRGGVPICFPQFSARGPLPKHGFARTSTWRAVPDAEPGTLHLQLRDTESTMRIWPNKFQLDLFAVLRPAQLEVRLEARNDGGEAWSFTSALHTYISVSNAMHARLRGLKGAETEDALAERFFISQEEVPDLSRPIDSVFYDVNRPLLLTDAERVLQIEKSGFADVVVWNPGAERAHLFPDIPASDVPRLLVVEAAQARQPVQIAPNTTWRGMQRLTVLQRDL